MIFLNPAVLFGLLAAAIPVLIHMLNLRKLKKVDFSTLKFLKELQKSKIRRIKFKQWLLLALRVLIILFTVFAFARPTLKGIALAGTTSASKTSAVIILDNSFSMSLVESEGSLFNQAKSEIVKILSQLKEGDDAEIIFTSNSKETVNKLTKNISSLKNRINESDISTVTGNITQAIEKGLSILSSSKNFNKELFVLSDFQKESFAELSKLKSVDMEDIRLYKINFGGKNYQNIGIDKLNLGTQIFEKNKPIVFNTKITNYSSDNIKDIIVSLFINGDRKTQKNINLNAGATASLELIAEVNTSGFINAFLEIEDDNISLDNRRYINFYIPSKIDVGLFSDNQVDVQFINAVLRSSKNIDEIKTNEHKTNQLASIELSKLDLIIFLPSNNRTNLKRLNDFINSGGGLLLLPGNSINEKDFNNILSNLSITANVTALGTKLANDNYTVFDKVDFEHPVFENIFSKKNKNEIDSPNILYHFNIDYKDIVKKIISLNDNSSFLTELKIGEGKVIIFNTAPSLEWSNFPIKGIFAPLLNKSIYYLASEDNSINNFIAGNEIKIKAGNYKGLIEIIKPNKASEFITLDDKSNYNFVNYSSADQTGFYNVRNKKDTISVFSVNTNPAESQQEYLNDDQIEDYLNKINFTGKYISIDKSEEIISVIQKARFGSEFWKILIIIALILALIEMLVSKSSKRDIAEITK